MLERALYIAAATGDQEIALVDSRLPPARATDAAFHFEPEKSYRETRAKYDGEFERRYVKWLLGRHDGNISAAAREAKMDRKHLHDMAENTASAAPRSKFPIAGDDGVRRGFSFRGALTPAARWRDRSPAP